MKIRTNNVPRLLKYGYEMPEKFKADFNYIDTEEFDTHDFFVFKGRWYDLAEFCTVLTPSGNPVFPGWDGYSSDSYFSGVLVKLVDSDRVIVGQYLC